MHELILSVGENALYSQSSSRKVVFFLTAPPKKKLALRTSRVGYYNKIIASEFILLVLEKADTCGGASEENCSF